MGQLNAAVSVITAPVNESRNHSPRKLKICGETELRQTAQGVAEK